MAVKSPKGVVCKVDHHDDENMTPNCQQDQCRRTSNIDTSHTVLWAVPSGCWTYIFNESANVTNSKGKELPFIIS